MTLRGLAGVAGLLLVLITAEMMGHGGGARLRPGPAPQPAAALAASAAVTARAPDTAALAAAILARPIFSMTRRPPVALAEPAAAEIASLPRLAGTFVAVGQQRAALLVPTGSARPILLHEGERSGAFKVTRISPGKVDVEGPHGPLSLQIGFSPAGPVSVAMPTPPPPMVNPRNRMDTEQDE